ncbi:sensor histidine kinase [Clostridium sp. B9]|uniref:sensor histidine kinase n=1 Tax=Clostridium sp. B9 TaxID=3423224 RepID=UPI003D2EED9C
MKKRLPVFQELTLGSLVIIMIILVVYTGVQLVSFTFFSRDYEKDLLENEYRKIVALAENRNIDISKENLTTYLDTYYTDDDEELIEIYNIEDTEKYIEYYGEYKNQKDLNKKDDIEIETEFKSLKFYDVLVAPIKIEDKIYIIKMVKDINIFKDFIESYFYSFVGIVILAIILSVFGAIYLSKIFLKRLNKLTDAMIDIQKNGIGERAEISDKNDEFDRVNKVFNSMMDEVEESFDEQRRFVSDASHELKTPLTALQGHLNMLKRWGKNDKERLEKSLDVCINEVNRLKKIVNDMLVLSRVEKDKVDLNTLKLYNPEKIISETLDSYKILNDKVDYTLSVEDGFKINMLEEHLKQLLIIFIDNAIKYNDKDAIKIKISLFSKDNKSIISVRDNGIGIPKEDLENVTNRFYKVDKSRVNNNSFGLGLSIASRIINLYKGNIIVDSQLDVFTEIKVVLNK